MTAPQLSVDTVNTPASTDSISTSTENVNIRFSAKNEMNIYEDIYYPKNQKEQSVFNRTLANKTYNLTDG